MIKFEMTEVVGFEHAIRGMRNPMNSWDKSDSDFNEDFEIGENDEKLMTSLSKAGSDHRKFMRMLEVYVDITAPLYWWKEYDTYKIGTVANSCSTMHKIHDKQFTIEDFSVEHLEEQTNIFTFTGDNCSYAFGTTKDYIKCLIELLNHHRDNYLETKDKHDWWQMIQLLPTSYNQKRTVMLSYEVLRNIYHSRQNHKLDEWHDFCKWIENLPYSGIITNL